MFFSVTSVTGLSRKLRFLFDYVRTFREIKGRFQKTRDIFAKTWDIFEKIWDFWEDMSQISFGGVDFLRRNGFGDSSVTVM